MMSDCGKKRLCLSIIWTAPNVYTNGQKLLHLLSPPAFAPPTLTQLKYDFMRHMTFPHTISKVPVPQEGMKTTITSHQGGILALADILDRTSNPPETGKAREIVDILDYVRSVI
jgi:hypothetical protein